MQTALLGLSEMLVSVFFAQWWLGERFSIQQWIGTLLLIISIALIGLEKPPSKKKGQGGFLSWVSPPNLNTKTWQPHE
jgi:drug/metabolite transporter (DMT)-like permease